MRLSYHYLDCGDTDGYASPGGGSGGQAGIEFADIFTLSASGCC